LIPKLAKRVQIRHGYAENDEIGRCTDATKQAYTDGVLVIVDDIAARLTPDDPQSARVKILSVFAMMVGTLQLSRALADRQLADQVLEESIQNALALLGAEQASQRRPSG
jgi:TetR/AcrR family transcriptional regulator, transcriptional repressor for nem operon